MRIYDKIKKLCDKQDITIAELEKRAEVGNGTVGKWREYTPTVATLSKVAKALGVKLEDLVA